MSQYEVCSLVDTTARREKEGLFADVRKMLPKSISRRLSRQIPFCVEIFVTGGKRIDLSGVFLHSGEYTFLTVIYAIAD